MCVLIVNSTHATNKPELRGQTDFVQDSQKLKKKKNILEKLLKVKMFPDELNEHCGLLGILVKYISQEF